MGHNRFGADLYLDRLAGVADEDTGNRRGAVRASAGLNTTDDDVRRLLAAVASVVACGSPVPYRQDPSTGDFFPVAGTPPEQAA